MSERLIDPRGKILKHPAVLARVKAGQPVWPLNVEVDPSNRCNLKCAWCDFAHVHDGSLLDIDVAHQLFDDLAAGGCQAVTLTGGGEPTVHPAFSHIARLAQTAGLQVGLYTNGTNVSPVLDCLEAFRWVYVSLDAATPGQYEAQKGRPMFWRVAEGIQALAAERDRTTVGVGFLLSDQNYEDAPAMARLADQLGADYSQFRPVVGLADYGWVPLALMLLDHLEGHRVYVSRERFLDLYRGTGRTYRLCRASSLVPCVGADGTVWVCPNTRGIRRLGSLKEERFGAIWDRRQPQAVGEDCRVQCRNHALNETLEYVCEEGAHDAFV